LIRLHQKKSRVRGRSDTVRETLHLYTSHEFFTFNNYLKFHPVYTIIITSQILDWTHTGWSGSNTDWLLRIYTSHYYVSEGFSVV